MELDTGVYLSSVRAEDWEPDDDPPGEVHMLVETDHLEAGLWRPAAGVTPETVAWSPPAREVIVVLKGEARIEIEGGPALELSAGSVASLPKGAKARWQCTADFVEFWVLEQA